jgi:hypothetical protein
MVTDATWLRSHLRDIEDFPKPGITFKDITPLLANVDAFRFTVDAIADAWAGANISHVAGIEARGFLLSAPVAYRLGVSLLPIRKPGKLPWEIVEQPYELEYGVDAVQAHRDAAQPGDRVRASAPSSGPVRTPPGSVGVRPASCGSGQAPPHHPSSPPGLTSPRHRAGDEEGRPSPAPRATGRAHHAPAAAAGTAARRPRWLPLRQVRVRQH